MSRWLRLPNPRRKKHKRTPFLTEKLHVKETSNVPNAELQPLGRVVLVDQRVAVESDGRGTPSKRAPAARLRSELCET